MATTTSINLSALSSSTIYVRTLLNLDGYLATSNHAADHPWREEIVRALAAPTGAPGSKHAPIVITCPFSKVHLDHSDLHDHALMRSAQLRGVLFGMQAADDADEMLALAYELSADLAEDIRATDFLTPRASQLPMLLLTMEGWKGPDDMLWLCQQFADELRAVLTLMLSNEVTKVAA